MKKLYEKNELTFALVWIAVYCVLQSLANPLNKMIGIDYECNAYVEQWDVEHWGVQYWAVPTSEG